MTPRELDAKVRWARGDSVHAAHALLSAVAPLTPPPLYGARLPELGAYVSMAAAHCKTTDEHVEVIAEEWPHLFGKDIAFLYEPPPELVPFVYLVTKTDRRGVHFLTPDGSALTTSRSLALDLFRHLAFAETDALVSRLVSGLPGRVDAKAVARTLRAQLTTRNAVAWAHVLRPSTNTSFADVQKKLRTWQSLLGVAALAALQSVLTLAAWSSIGNAALSGHADVAVIVGWSLLSLAAVVLQIAITRRVGRYAMNAATEFRSLLLHRAQKLDASKLSALGLSGLVVMSSHVDGFAQALLPLFLVLSVSLTAVFSTLVVLAVAPMAALSTLMFVGFALGTLSVYWPLTRGLHAVRDQRSRLTSDMVQRMLGHRTRLVQAEPGSWHDREDGPVHDYAQRTVLVDRTTLALRTLPRAYYAAGLAFVMMVLLQRPTPADLALVLGGLALGMSALTALSELVAAAAQLSSLWASFRSLVTAPSADEPLGDREPERRALEDGDLDTRPQAPVVELRDVSFSYRAEDALPTHVLRNLDLTLKRGDRLLVEGASGAGKTTLAAVLAGIAEPSKGLLLLNGVDQHGLDPVLRPRLLAFAPQFYRNHVFTQSLAFNLLLGRGWPPTGRDLADAREVATDLGLGSLLENMPAGLFQHVGEAGWQLSHGERSRVYLARCLLQRSPVVVLDETFGALDPASLDQCMRAVLRRAETLVVITHR